MSKTWKQPVVTIGIAILWLIGNLVWLSQDKLVRDGDEDGHVGAAELFAQTLTEQGWIIWATEAWHGDYGEYPPLFAAFVGAWWSFFEGDPNNPWIRSFCLLSVFFCAVGAGWLCQQMRGPWIIAFAFTLFAPLLNGIGRHFMLEGFVAMWTALFAASFYRAITHPAYHSAALSGLFFGFGMLSKQTFIIVALPVFLLAYRMRLSIIAFIATSLLICGPWYYTQFGKQQEYLQQSVQSDENAGILFQIAGPIADFTWDVVGPLGSALIIWGIWKLYRAPNTAQKRLLIWLAIGLLLFICIPKKYPRLLLGMTPLAAVFIALGLRDLRGNVQLLITTIPMIWLLIGSTQQLSGSFFRQQVDDGARQIWLRPYDSRDFGLLLLLDLAQTKQGGTIAIANSPQFPSSIQTTHGWSYHVEPYLRRNGVEMEVVETTPDSAMWRKAELRVLWYGNIEQKPLPVKINDKPYFHWQQR